VSLLVGAALVLAGCSSSAAKPATSSTTTSAPTTTTTAAASQACKSSQVAVTASTSQGAAGTLVQRFLVTNNGSARCTMNGVPFISPYGPQPQGGSEVEANLPVNVRPISADSGAIGAAGTLINVSAGQSAVFFLKWSDVASSAPCHKADGFDFRTPQAAMDDQKLVTFSFSGGICGGTLSVSRILPSSVTG
jgi:hypothetical protein